MTEILNAKFYIGQLVQHRQLQQRGVVAEVDSSFEAPDEVHEQLEDQAPAKDQPWYHVLLDDSHQVVYVAEDDLAHDLLNEPVEHPLTKHFFNGFKDGRYVGPTLN